MSDALLSQPMNIVRRITFYGLGQMGRAMVGHLINAGFDVVGIDPSSVAREQSTTLNLLTCDSPASIEDHGQCVFACVPHPNDLYCIAQYYVQLPHEFRPRFFVNLSTVGPRVADKVDQILADGGPSPIFIESPITGGVLRAGQRKASLLCGCRDKHALGQLLPVLHLMAAKVIVMEGVLEASIAKLINNISVIVNTFGTLEGIALGVKSGIPLDQIFAVLEQGTASSYVVSSTLRRPLMTGDFHTGFATRLALKDLYLAQEYAAEVGLSMPLVSQAMDQLEKAMQAGLGDLVFPSVAQLLGIADPQPKADPLVKHSPYTPSPIVNQPPGGIVDKVMNTDRSE